MYIFQWCLESVPFQNVGYIYIWAHAKNNPMSKAFSQVILLIVFLRDVGMYDDSGFIINSMVPTIPAIDVRSTFEERATCSHFTWKSVLTHNEELNMKDY